MKIDFDSIPDVYDAAAIPEGVYPVQVMEIFARETQSGDPIWSMRLEVASGEFAGRHAGWDSLIFSERGLPRAKQVLAFLGLEVVGELDLTQEGLIGRKARAQFFVEEYESKGKLRREMRVPYDGWSSLGEEEEVDAAAPAREALRSDTPF